MTGTSTPEVTVTLKGDGSAPWIVYHAGSVAEGEALILESLKSLLETAADASDLFAGTIRTANLRQPAQSAPQQPQDAPQGNPWPNAPQNPQGPPQWQQNQAQPSGFNGTPHPEGRTCQKCGAGVVGKQPKVKRMWTCPNQRSKDDGHYLEWING